MTEPQDSTSKAAIPIELLKTDIAFLKRLFTSPTRRAHGKGASGYRRDVAYATMRELLGGLGAKQIQFLTPTTDKVYNYVTKAKGAVPKTVTLGEGAQGHWIGNTQASYVMLYLHGGGFYGAATMGHLRYMYALQKEMAKLGHDFSIFALTYTLSPGGVYPLQLRQAALALNYLVTEENRDPSTVLLGGDSAGGNLTAALLEHISHPHPEVLAITLPRPLHSALMISPWASFRTDWPAFESNAESDYITPRAVKRAACTYIAPGSGHDIYSEPATSPPEWWADIANDTVRNVMIWGGGGEVLLDGIRSFADKVGAGFASADTAALYGDGGEKRPPRFTFIVTPKCAHEEMIIDELLFGLVKGDAAREVEKWLSAVLS